MMGILGILGISINPISPFQGYLSEKKKIQISQKSFTPIHTYIHTYTQGHKNEVLLYLEFIAIFLQS